MPVDVFNVDAAVMYADIMLPLEAMGVSFAIEPDVGPIVQNPVRGEADVSRLRVVDAEEATPYVLEAIRMLRRELTGRAALVGFAGGPFTLACYMIEGRPSRDFARTRALMFERPDLWARLMETLSEVVGRYLRGQIEAGVQVVQLFDSWAGVLGPRTYERQVLPYSAHAFSMLRDLSVPSIHFGTGTASLLELMAQAGSDLVAVDWRQPLDQAWARIGWDKGIQGNLDPSVLFASPEVIQEETQDVLRRAGGRPGHIFNLGHGVLPETPPAALTRVAQLVHEAGWPS
jgi:uroporphyrinogen decarboxylase